jgi:hypothetical protein
LLENLSHFYIISVRINEVLAHEIGVKKEIATDIFTVPHKPNSTVLKAATPDFREIGHRLL